MVQSNLAGEKPPEDPRVRFAAERTLLAWMRTGLALMGFGFVVARFTLFLREFGAVGRATTPEILPAGSIWIGTGLIALGVVVCLLGSFEYFRFLRESQRGKTYLPRTALLAVVVAVILGFLGIGMVLFLILKHPLGLP
jgi:putative membrane protein